MAIRANLECGSLLPLSARLLAGALWAGSKLPAQKAEQAPALHIDATLTWPLTFGPGYVKVPNGKITG